MRCIFLQTKSVDIFSYALEWVMHFQKYVLWGARLYWLFPLTYLQNVAVLSAILAPQRWSFPIIVFGMNSIVSNIFKLSSQLWKPQRWQQGRAMHAISRDCIATSYLDSFPFAMPLVAAFASANVPLIISITNS